MVQSKLSYILRSLTKNEFKEFGKFLRSPYFNNSERDLDSFYRAIKPSYPQFNITREEIYNKLYPGRKYNEKTIKNYFTDIYKMAVEFLTYNNIRQKKDFVSSFRAEALLKKNLQKEFLNTSGSTLEILTEEKIGSEDYFINLRRYYQQKMIFSKSTYKDKNESEHILNSIECLAVLLLKDLSNVLVNKQLSVYLNTNENNSKLLDALIGCMDLDKFMDKFGALNSGFYPYVAFRYYLYKDLCETDNFTWFYKMKDIIYSNISNFSRETQFEATWAVINSCAMTSRRTIPEMRKESFQMLKLQLQLGLHIAPGSSYYSIPAFNQFLTEALYFKEYGMVEKIIKDHSCELEPGIRDDMKNWAYASLYFDKGEYALSLSYASKINFKEPNFRVQSKFLLFRIFFELDLHEQAESILNTSLHALKLEDLSTEVKSRYELSFKNSAKLLKLKSNFSTEDAEFFKRKITAEIFVGKKWMLEKLSISLTAN